MTQVGMSKVLGRALLDREFATKLQKDPATAAKSIGASLTPAEQKSVKDLSVAHMNTVSDMLRKRLPSAAFFDQQQQQQQARMD
jgi:hypothetical protein